MDLSEKENPSQMFVKGDPFHLDGLGKEGTMDVYSNTHSLQLKEDEDCTKLIQIKETNEQLGQQIHLKNEEQKERLYEMSKEEEDVDEEECDKLEVAGQTLKERRDGCTPKTNKRNKKVGMMKETFREMQKDEAAEGENVCASQEDCSKVKTAAEDKQKIFKKRKGTSGIGGQLYEIYLVLLILLHGLTNKNITHFHLASNLEGAGDFDDVVFSYSYKDLKGAEKIKVIFLQAKHREKTKNITLEEFLGKTGKGDFDLKKYFKSFRSIKKNFEEGDPTDPIFGTNFNDCEFIIYTNSLFKIGYTEKIYINELLAEEDWILNFSGKKIKYYQLRVSEEKNHRIKTFLNSYGESEEKEFHDFLCKLKICTAQPNQDQLMEILKEKIHFHYGVIKSDIEDVFPVVKNKIEAWWKNSSDYLTKKNTFIQHAARYSITFDVQDPVPGFTGREQSLRDLHEALQTTGQSVISQSASITGLGGIGKTELARKYVSQYSQYYDNNVIWINAETSVTCSESFRRLAGDVLEIGIKNRDGKDKDITSITSEVYAFFAKRNKKSLFIFDNAENLQDSTTAKEEENVKNFLPSGHNKPYVLITSRNQQWGGIKSLQLDLFTNEESAQFIKNYLSERRIELDENEIKSLGEILQYLPLALRQAVAYIAIENERLKNWNESYTIGNYLKGFEDKAKEMLGKAPQDVFDTYAKTVLTTWQVTIEKIKLNEMYGMQSLLILNIIAFFAPNSIPVVTIFESLMGKENVRGCVGILEQYSLIKLQSGEVSIHRLLQQVIRMMLKSEGNEEEILKSSLTLFKMTINSNCIVHLRSVWEYAKNFNKIVQSFSWVPLLIIRRLVNAIKYNDSYSFVVMTHKLFQEVLGDRHPDTLMSLQMKATILYEQGKYFEAVKVGQEALLKRREILGLDHPDTLKTIDNLAIVLTKQGKYEESFNLYQEVLCKKKDILGRDHPNTLDTISNLASVLDKQGKYEESAILYQEVLYKRKQILGPNHLHTLNSMHNWAFVLDKQGKYEESLILYQEVLYKRKEILGPHHPNTLHTMHNLASVLDKQGKYKESLILYQKLLHTRKEILGLVHPNTLDTMNNLVFVFCQLGKYEESLILSREVVCKRKNILGPDHPNTLNAMNNLASILDKQEKYEELLILHQEVLFKRKEILGPGHSNTLNTMHNLASVLEKLGKYEESLNLNREVLHKRKEILGPDHPTTLRSMNNLAFVLAKQGKYEESLILNQDVLCKRKEILGPNHPDTLSTMQNLASVLDKQGKYDESLILHQEVLSKRKEILGLDHPETLNTMHNLNSLSPRSKISRLKSILKRIFRRPR